MDIQAVKNKRGQALFAMVVFGFTTLALALLVEGIGWIVALVGFYSIFLALSLRWLWKYSTWNR